MSVTGERPECTLHIDIQHVAYKGGVQYICILHASFVFAMNIPNFADCEIRVKKLPLEYTCLSISQP